MMGPPVLKDQEAAVSFRVAKRVAEQPDRSKPVAVKRRVHILDNIDISTAFEETESAETCTHEIEGEAQKNEGGTCLSRITTFFCC